MSNQQLEQWDVWYPFAAATGISFARGRLDHTDTLWIHSAPDAVTVEVRSDAGRLLARGQDLKRTTNESLPMTRLMRVGDTVLRDDRWPAEDATGEVVILPGGEAGILKSWWHAPDHSEWRWHVEFYNRR